MTDRLIRLMRIITLIQAKPGILARELSERCGTSERTIYRDMDALSAMHIPITHQGYGKGYKFIGNFALHPLDWTEEEMLAFTELPTIMDQLRPILPQGFESAYEKVMAANHKQKADRMEIEQLDDQDSEYVSNKKDKKELVRGAKEKSDFLIPVLMATLNHHTIYAHYRLPEQQDMTQSRIDPYLLIPCKQDFKLLGRNHSTGEVLTYPLHYFKQIEVLDDRFYTVHKNSHHESPTPDVQESTAPLLFKIKLSSVVTEMFKSCEHKYALLDRVSGSDGSLIYEWLVTDTIEFLSCLRQYGADAEILEPLQYREMMKEHLLKWLKLYQ
ncbi:helix-turn-helix transcriptional regulator [Paenibacillus pini]|uniref:Transcriptional regulator n=1 Tax=Paenibacillus pini JCM 16418 TaxID=1236976 RepID=W7YVI9_9BACL|nr:WYL domain-containing protein [Paenibacillus pini]GAF08596.1 hypothetical protein JCM16418_2680 [Paenibacillus pini JCM 16418]